MPKQTFYNLEITKRDRITEVLIQEFESHSLEEATVKHIVEKLQIPRGSFYQYFDSLTEAYFYILDTQLTEVHELFQSLLEKEGNNVHAVLEKYGAQIYELVTKKEKVKLYRSRYLYWNSKLNLEWSKYRKEKSKAIMNQAFFQKEEFRFLGIVVHGLIQRLLSENLSQSQFLDLYEHYMTWIQGGIHL